MKTGKPLAAVLLGILSAIPFEIFTRILLYFGVGKYSATQLTSLIVTLNRPITLLGILVMSIVSGSIAVTFYYMLNKLGTDYLILKAIATGMVSWIVMETIYTWLIEGPKLIPHRPVSDYYLEASGSIIFGITLGLLIKKFLIGKVSHVYRIKD